VTTAWHGGEPAQSATWLDDADPAAREFVAQVWDALAAVSPGGIAGAWLNAEGIFKDAIRGAVPPPPLSVPGPPTPAVPSDAEPSPELLAAALAWLGQRGFLDRFAASLAEVLPRLWARAWADGQARARHLIAQLTPAQHAAAAGKKKPKGKKNKKGTTQRQGTPPPGPPALPPAQLLALLLASSAAFAAWATGTALAAEVALIVASLARRVAVLLATASARGWTARQLAEALEQAFLARWRAEMITATEATRADQAAMLAEYRAAGIRWVRWVTRRDNRVCARCLANEAKGTIRLGKKFPSGDLAPPAHPRCRCYLIPSTLWNRITGKDDGPALVKAVKPWKAPGAAGDKVYRQLLADYPPAAIAWVREAEWTGPVRVPFSQVNYTPEKWQARHEQGKVTRFRDKIRRQLAAGKMTRPVVMIDRPDTGRGTHLVVIDGHHRTIAFHQLGEPVVAWVGKVPSMAVARRAEQSHSYQYREGHAGASAYAAAKDEASVAGVAVLAADTGRVLMLQRHLADDGDDPAGGSWEFPGGRLDAGEDPWDAARREWCEETGCGFPDGQLTGSWRSGKYQGFVVTVPHESDIPAFAGRGQVVNPDDPDGDDTEALAWWQPADLENPVIRREVAESAALIRGALAGQGTVKALRAAGWPYGQIAALLGCTPASARDAVKHAKVTKESVHYRAATLPGRACKTCVMFRGNGPAGTCDLVKGTILPDDTCDRWAPLDVTSPPGVQGKSAETPMLEATPHLLGPNGLWRTPSKKVPVRQKLPNYIENIAAALMRDHGMGEQQAIATAINAVKRWARGDLHWGHGKVTEEVIGASQRALAEWEELRATHG
jgi:SPP1 gp7 family putative phage head morphogenesis protein